jgi:hypothetical protein
MRKRVEILGLLCAGLTLVAGGGHARADFTVAPPTVTVPLTPTNWGPTTTSLAGIDPLAIQQFDASKYSTPGHVATLTGVDVTLDFEFDNRVILTFTTMSTITVAATGTMDLFLPDGTTRLVPSATFANTGSLTVNPATLLMKTFGLPNPPDFTKFPGSTPTVSYTDAATISQFTGKSTINLKAFAQATSNFKTSSGNGFGSSVTLATATVHVLYHYTLMVVPEPSSVALTGIGALGLLVLGRNALRKNQSMEC